MLQKKSKPIICCLDLEGILVPEVWIQVAKKTGISGLRLTTRDISDYDQLMRYRLKILREHGITLRRIQKIIGGMMPLPGAKAFLDQLRQVAPVVILSDTYYEFAFSFMKRLGQPVLFCNSLKTDRKGFIVNYHLRIRDGKSKAVRALKALNFFVKAVGDSYNDLTMLRAAHCGILYNPPVSIRKANPGFPAAYDYSALYRHLTA